jgi:hypothetical protein
MATLEELEKRVKWLEDHFQHEHRWFWASYTSSPMDRNGDFIVMDDPDV